MGGAETIAATQVDRHHLGTGMGLIGMLKNAGKVSGPVLGGFLVHWLDFVPMFWCLSLLTLAGSGLVWHRSRHRDRSAVRPSSQESATAKPLRESRR